MRRLADDSHRTTGAVILDNAGIHGYQGLVPWVLDPRIRGGDDGNVESLG